MKAFLSPPNLSLNSAQHMTLLLRICWLSTLCQSPAWHTTSIFYSKLCAGKVFFEGTLPVCVTLYIASLPPHSCPLFSYWCRYSYLSSCLPLSKNNSYVALHTRYFQLCTRLTSWNLSTLLHWILRSGNDYLKTRTLAIDLIERFLRVELTRKKRQFLMRRNYSIFIS